jgi:hypothetical protein
MFTNKNLQKVSDQNDQYIKSYTMKLNNISNDIKAFNNLVFSLGINPDVFLHIKNEDVSGKLVWRECEGICWIDDNGSERRLIETKVKIRVAVYDHLHVFLEHCLKLIRSEKCL